MGNKKNTIPIYPYFVTEHGGFLAPAYLNILLQQFEDRGWEPQDLGMGSAYNMPVYLLGEMEEHYGQAMVFSLYMEDDGPRIMAFIGKPEIDPLMEALEAAGDDEDSFDICKAVHKKIRGLA